MRDKLACKEKKFGIISFPRAEKKEWLMPPTRLESGMESILFNEWIKLNFKLNLISV